MGFNSGFKGLKGSNCTYKFVDTGTVVIVQFLDFPWEAT